MEIYLKCTDVIDCDAKSIKEKNEELARGPGTAKEKAIALFYFVRDGIKHDPYSPGYLPENYRASETLKRGSGFCTHKAILLTALARAAGIPARLGFADIRDNLLSPKFRGMIGGGNLLIYHGYAELYIDGKWVHASPAVDVETCQQNGFVPVDFDGANDAKDPPHNRQGKPHIEYVRDHGHYEDFPWEEISSAGKKFWANLGKEWDQVVADWWGGNK